MVKTRSATRREKEAAIEKFDRENRGKGTSDDPYLLDQVGPPPGFTEADRMGFAEDDKERVSKIIRRNIRMKRQGFSIFRGAVF